MLENIGDFIQRANQIGVPIPLILILILFYWAISIKINWWPKREKHYEILLRNLGIWRDCLTDTLDWYSAPGSDYDNTIPYKKPVLTLRKKISDAKKIVREEMNYAKIFLGENSVKSLDSLFQKSWHILNVESACYKEYVESTLEVVSETYEAIFENARKDLKRSLYKEMLLKLTTRSS